MRQKLSKILVKGGAGMIMHKIHDWLLDMPDQRDYLYSAIKPKIRLPYKNGFAATLFYCIKIGEVGPLHRLIEPMCVEFIEEK